MKRLSRWDVCRRAEKDYGKLSHIYLHWTAGFYDQTFPDYHLNVTGTGDILSASERFTELLSHTYLRNSGAIGIAMCCAKDAIMYADRSFDLGVFPPSPVQVEETAALVALLTLTLDIPLDKAHVMTHAEAADLDGYGPALAGTNRFERWDLYEIKDGDGKWKYGGDVLRGKAQWYRHHLASLLPFQLAY
ncbi:N-acetylmuramoyl-L-alanine amidase [uncultured Acidaminococcus sp.]|uniref:N-acetylmuramoyl-L-alanine amidase n=1 Tax=uncultured Acidaminococcus sp. TaxID=352152 RepID=UPI0025F4E6B4|nr:N-acetylmuramoyl-L-alanine amidase [uncultured Acidaminococcus sp.]